LVCDLATESCGAALCEGEQSCSASAGPLLAIPNQQAHGLCFHDGEILLVAGGSLQRFGWPDLEARRSHRLGPQVLGDCALLDGVVYYPDVRASSIGTLVLSTGEGNLYAIGAPAPAPRAVAADQGTLWVSTDTSPLIFRLSTKGDLLGDVPNTATTNACDGLEATATGLWCLDLASTVLFKLSKQDGSVLAGPFFGPPLYGLALIHGTLWSASTGMQYDPEGGLTGSSVGGLVPFVLNGVAP
jgi:hypothetical protein